ncbi:hypothetical protein BC830DRAFT_913002 [Chytriomyces sp. MP71]|nr:hypothetical protein BC830DRAFT_913002 [Chytriomyces sp. MP71]
MNAQNCPTSLPRARPQLASEYAYILKPNGILAIVTEVRGLNEWMVKLLDAHLLFERLSEGVGHSLCRCSEERDGRSQQC